MSLKVNMFRIWSTACIILVLNLLVLAKAATLFNYEEPQTNELNSESKPIKWFKGMQDMASSPAGHVVVQVAKELLNRSAGNSQVCVGKCICYKETINRFIPFFVAGPEFKCNEFDNNPATESVDIFRGYFGCWTLE